MSVSSEFPLRKFEFKSEYMARDMKALLWGFGLYDLITWAIRVTVTANTEGFECREAAEVKRHGKQRVSGFWKFGRNISPAFVHMACDMNALVQG